MLKQLRTNTKWIMIIVIIGFVGMIVLQWGMNIGSRRPGSQTGMMIGEVNGIEIRYDMYDRLVKNQRDMLGSNQRITFDQTRRIHEEVWDYIVTNILVEKEIENRGITYTDKELLNYMLKNPVQGAEQIELFKENDAFSIVKYQAFIQNPQNLSDPSARQFLDIVEMQAKNALPRIKLQQSLEDGVIITNSRVRERLMRENEQRNIDWLFVSITGLRAYPASVEPEVLRAYYEEHKEDYKHEEMRGLEAVFFSLSPTTDDTTEVLERAELLAERAKSGEDFAELADSYSEDPGNQRYDGNKYGGDLGFFGKGAMVKEFDDIAFGLKPGEVSDPFLTRFGYHVVKVDSIKYAEDKKEIDQVKARHILLGIEPSGKTQEMISNRVKAFSELLESGMDFDLQAQKDSLNVIKTLMFFEDAQFVPNIGNNAQLLSTRAFMADKDDILPVYITDDGYYIIKVSEIVKAGIPPFEELQNRITEDVKREMRAEYTEDFCRRVYNQVKAGKGLRETVDAMTDSLILETVETATVTRSYIIPGLGTMNALIARVFTLEDAGDNTGPVITENGSGMAVLLEKLPVDEKKFEEEKAQLKTELENELKNDIMSRYINNLRENAEIVDNRYLFFNL